MKKMPIVVANNHPGEDAGAEGMPAPGTCTARITSGDISQNERRTTS